MNNLEFSIMSSLQYQVKDLKAKVAAFESGEMYTHMRAEFQKQINERDEEIKKLKRELQITREKTKKVRKDFMQVNEDLYDENNKLKEQINKEREQHEAEKAQLKANIAAKKELAKTLKEEKYAVETQLDEEKQKVDLLTSRLNKDYTNSSKSSSQSPNHKKIANNREKSGKKQGGQDGHKHFGRKQHTPTTTIHIPTPEAYQDENRYKKTGKVIKKQVVSVNINVLVTEYEADEYQDKKTGHKVHAAFPEGIQEDVTYDASVEALLFYLNNACNVSIAKTQTFLRETTNNELNVSTGKIASLVKKFSKKTEKERTEIFNALLQQPAMHADFTFARVNGKTAAVAVCAADNLVLFQAREHKGHEGIKDTPIEVYDRVLITDHESALLHYAKLHQECLIHVERYLRGSIERETDLTWNKQMLDWVQQTIHFWNERHDGKNVDPNTVEQLKTMFQEILNCGSNEYEYTPPTKYNREGFNLLTRMKEKPQDYLLTLDDPNVEPTNNLAERCGRKVKRKAAQVMSFRSQKWFEYYCDSLTIITYLQSANVNLFENLKNRFAL